MKSKFKNIFLLLLSFSSFCIAQESYLIDLVPQQVDSLSGDFYIVKVEDERQRKNKIGAIQLNGKMYAANFPRPFEDYTYATLARMNPYSKKGQPVSVKIHQFLIEEKKKNDKNISQTTIQLEFFSINSSKSIGIVTATAREEGAKVIRKHSVTILKALKKCLLEFDRLNSSFYTDSKTPLNIPPKAGLYFSFSEVMLGQATIPTKPIKLEILFTELERYELKTKEKKEVIKSLYGISDGTNFYLNSRLYSEEPYFIKAKMMGAHFYFEDIVYNGLAQAALGMLGSALYEKKVGIIINTANGRLSILDENVFFEIINPYPELLKMYEDSNKKLKIKRILLQKVNQQLSDTFNENK